MHSPLFIDDLIPLILESHDNWWDADLLRLALVSYSWLRPIRKRLYAMPRLRTFRACSLLAQSLRNNPDLVPFIQGLDIRPDADATCDMHGLRFLLGLPGLTSLTLGGELAAQADRFMHLVSNPQSIAYLHIDGNIQNMGSGFFCGNSTCLEWDETMAFKFHSVRKLRLSNLELDIVAPSVPYQTAITDLELANVTIANGELSHIMNQSWSSVETLNVLATSEAEYDMQIKGMLDVCENLRVLRYEIKHAVGHPEPIFDDNSGVFPSLRHVCLGGRLDPSVLASVTRCCPRIETLSISGRPASITPEQWLAFVQSACPISMKELSIPWMTYNPPFQLCWSAEQLQPILDACKTRGITLSPARRSCI